MPSRGQVLRERRRTSGRHTHEACPREGGEWVSSALDSLFHGNDSASIRVTPKSPGCIVPARDTWLGMTQEHRKTPYRTRRDFGLSFPLCIMVWL